MFSCTSRYISRGSCWILLSVLRLLLSKFLFQTKYKNTLAFFFLDNIGADFYIQPRTSLQVMTRILHHDKNPPYHSCQRFIKFTTWRKRQWKSRQWVHHSLGFSLNSLSVNRWEIHCELLTTWELPLTQEAPEMQKILGKYSEELSFITIVLMPVLRHLLLTAVRDRRLRLDGLVLPVK